MKLYSDKLCIEIPQKVYLFGKCVFSYDFICFTKARQNKAIIPKARYAEKIHCFRQKNIVMLSALQLIQKWQRLLQQILNWAHKTIEELE